LLEPIDLTDKPPIHGIYASALPDRPAISQNRLTRATSSARSRTRAERRSPLKPALMIAGALACFGAGTAVPQLQALMSSGTSYWGILDTASGPSASVDQLAKLDALKSAKPQAAVPISGPANSGVAQPASGTQTPPASSSEQDVSTVAQAAQSESAPAEQVVNCAAPCNQQPCPKNDANCLEGGAVSPPQVSTKPDSPAKTRESKTGEATVPLRDATNSPGANAEARASGRQEEQSSRRNKRAAQRSTADRASAARRTAGNTSQSGRDQDMRPTSAWGRKWGSDEHVPTANSSAGWPDRDANRAAGGWRERNADDYFSTTRSAERGVNRDTDQPANWRRERAGEDRWQDRGAGRTWSSRRDRYGDYPRNDDRRLRAVRDDDFVTGRAERIEGPLMILPPARMRW
jgi:hypothetical protein